MEIRSLLDGWFRHTNARATFYSKEPGFDMVLVGVGEQPVPLLAALPLVAFPVAKDSDTINEKRIVVITRSRARSSQVVETGVEVSRA